MAWRLVIGLALGLVACQRSPPPAAVAAQTSLADEARSLVAQGDADAALARLQGADQADGEVLYLEGLAWARKAETAPAGSGSTSTSAPGGSWSADLKPEEEQALAFLEKAVAARPDLAAAHLALADLLGPHALRRETRASGGRRRDDRIPAASSNSGVDRVLQAYRQAAQADLSSPAVVEAWIGFATKAGRLDEADAGFQQLLLRDKENAAPFLRYGDFLRTDRKDALGAINAYSRALIWQPNLEAARSRIAEIYLAEAAAHFGRKEYASAQARLADAQKYVGPSAESPEGLRLRQLQSQLAQIRRR